MKQNPVERNIIRKFSHPLHTVTLGSPTAPHASHSFAVLAPAPRPAYLNITGNFISASARKNTFFCVKVHYEKTSNLNPDLRLERNPVSECCYGDSNPSRGRERPA